MLQKTDNSPSLERNQRTQGGVVLATGLELSWRDFSLAMTCRVECWFGTLPHMLDHEVLGLLQIWMLGSLRLRGALLDEQLATVGCSLLTWLNSARVFTMHCGQGVRSSRVF